MNIGIIGAGTAGLAAAIAFARAGHGVTVFEKHASLTPLGAGLLIQPQGVAALDALGVGAAFSAASVPVDRLLGTCHRNWTLVDVTYLAAQAGASAGQHCRNSCSTPRLRSASGSGTTVRWTGSSAATTGPSSTCEGR